MTIQSRKRRVIAEAEWTKARPIPHTAGPHARQSAAPMVRVSLAYVLMRALRRVALAGTELARASCGSIWLKLFTIGAQITIRVGRVKIAFASFYGQQLFASRLRTAQTVGGLSPAQIRNKQETIKEPSHTASAATRPPCCPK
jgi:Transposase DDE domain group 1